MDFNVMIDSNTLSKLGRVQAECIKVGENIVGDPECKRYEVYRSSFKAIPVGSIADRPEAF